MELLFLSLCRAYRGADMCSPLPIAQPSIFQVTNFPMVQISDSELPHSEMKFQQAGLRSVALVVQISAKEVHTIKK